MRDKVHNRKTNTQTHEADPKEEKSKKRRFAEVMFSPSTLNTFTVINYTSGAKSKDDNVDACEAVKVMLEKVQSVNNGDIKALEETLTAQVSALNAIFNSLAIESKLSETMSNMETYLRLALKAQSQCARTIEVLANMKNPPLVVAKQANIANGHQQVNNSTSATDVNNNRSSRAEKTKNKTNELLEVDDGSEKMDIRAAQTAGRKGKAMATLEKEHRSEDA